jgi:DNA-binding transcriptional LysR family regulator
LFAALNRPPQIVEEHDSITSLLAAVESGRGVAVMAQPLNGLGSPRLKIRPLQPAPPPLGVGIAYRKKFRSTATDNFIEAARRAKVDWRVVTLISLSARAESSGLALPLKPVRADQRGKAGFRIL